MDSLIEELLPIIESRNMLVREAETAYVAQVNEIIRGKSTDVQQIEWTLSGGLPRLPCGERCGEERERG